MKYKNRIITIFAIVIIASLIIILFWQSQSASKHANTTSSRDSQQSVVLYAAYDYSNPSERHIYRFDPATQKSSLIYSSIVNDQFETSPSYYLYGDRYVILYNAGPEGNNLMIDSFGDHVDQFIPPNPFFHLLSPSGEALAYTIVDYSVEINDIFVVRDTITNEEMRTEGVGEIRGIDALLRPIAWFQDERIVYAEAVAPTEGYFVGLYSINAKTGEKSSIPFADQAGLVQIQIDNNLRAYGVKESEIDLFGQQKPFDIYSFSLLDGTTGIYTLQHSKIDQFFGVDPNGKYLVYSWSEDYFTEDLWLYDIETQKEIRLTIDSVIYEKPYWNNGRLVYRGATQSENSDEYTSFIRIYDTKTNTTMTVQESQGDELSLIGWIYS